MANYTPKLHLKKPENSEQYNIADFNGNSDIIDNSLGASNGIATLGNDGRIPYEQMPESTMNLKGMWDAQTNTPTLTDASGSIGDFYIVSVAGTQTFAGVSISFAVDERVIRVKDTDNVVKWKKLGAGAVKDIKTPNGTSVVNNGIGIIPLINFLIDSVSKLDASTGNVNIITNIANSLLKLNSSGKIPNGLFPPSIGGNSSPLKIDASGNITTGSTYAGGTSLTINGSSKAGSSASIYAPTSYGTSGYYLKSNGSGSAPSWVSPPSSYTKFYFHRIKTDDSPSGTSPHLYTFGFVLDYMSGAKSKLSGIVQGMFFKAYYQYDGGIEHREITGFPFFSKDLGASEVQSVSDTVETVYLS